MCGTHLKDRHEIEVVDVFKEPRRGLPRGTFMAPTLVTRAPSRACKIVGTLSQTQLVLHTLGLDTSVA